GGTPEPLIERRGIVDAFGDVELGDGDLEPGSGDLVEEIAENLGVKASADVEMALHPEPIERHALAAQRLDQSEQRLPPALLVTLGVVDVVFVEIELGGRRVRTRDRKRLSDIVRAAHPIEE